MEIIGLSGFARVGKDEAAKVLVEEFGFTQIAFANRLRNFLYDLNPIVDFLGREVAVDNGYLDGEILAKAPVVGGSGPIYVQNIIDRTGWDGYKETKYKDEIRRLLQRLGTEAGRQNLGDTIWIDAAFRGLPDDAKIVVSDPRFFNEFDAIRARGGEVWRIERAGVGPLNDHASENEATSYPHFALTVTNYYSLDEYKENIRKTYRERNPE